MKISEFVTTKTAAKELDLAVRTIQNMIKEGKIPAKKFGQLYLIDRRQWEEWKARNIVAA
jgi:excisionase family DNA binding protein